MSKFISSIDLLGTVISITNTVTTTTITTTSHHQHNPCLKCKQQWEFLDLKPLKENQGLKLIKK